MDMIEKVARAIWDAGFDRMPDPTWENTSHLQKEFHRMLGRSAIEAMREPSEQMLDAVCASSKDYFGGETEAQYTRMIDAALAE